MTIHGRQMVPARMEPIWSPYGTNIPVWDPYIAHGNAGGVPWVAPYVMDESLEVGNEESLKSSNVIASELALAERVQLTRKIGFLMAHKTRRIVQVCQL